MALEYKVDILSALKAAGYSTDKLRQRKYLSESVIQHLRKREPISWATIERVCSLLEVQPGDILAYNGTPSHGKIGKEKDMEQSRREFEYLWWIWDTKFRKPGETGAAFNPAQYKCYLPIPKDWKPGR